MRDNTWQHVVKRVASSGTTSGATSDNEWQQVIIWPNFRYFWIREEPTTKHKEKPSNFEEDLEENLLN